MGWERSVLHMDSLEKKKKKQKKTFKPWWKISVSFIKDGILVDYKYITTFKYSLNVLTF